MRVLLLLALMQASGAFYLSHVFQFPSIPYSAGVYHIHSPAHFMEAHGFTLPGFRILETCAPKSMGDYVTVEFFYETYFNGRTSARVFSSSKNTSHVLLMDPDGVPCLLGRLSLEKYPPHGHRIRAHADLLRPANVWERMLGGKRLVKQCNVERAIQVGYSNFKSDMRMKEYMNLVMDCARRRGA
jgi:hypothetical protein